MATARWLTLAGMLLSASCALSQPAAKFEAFEVATIKPVASDVKTSRYIKMQDGHLFLAKDYTLHLLIAAAYDLSPQTISGGPAWADSDHYDIQATTPGETKPTRDEQMRMLRVLLTERFGLTFHREQKEFAIYSLNIAKGGAKLKPSASIPDAPAALVSMVYPQKIALPARNATMQEFASVLQRAVLDRPVVDHTGLTGRYDFDLEWAPDEAQFNGDVVAAPADAPTAPFFTAIQQQLGLKLEATRGPIAALVIDKADHPSPN